MGQRRGDDIKIPGNKGTCNSGYRASAAYLACTDPWNPGLHRSTDPWPASIHGPGLHRSSDPWPAPIHGSLDCTDPWNPGLHRSTDPWPASIHGPDLHGSLACTGPQIPGLHRSTDPWTAPIHGSLDCTDPRTLRLAPKNIINEGTLDRHLKVRTEHFPLVRPTSIPTGPLVGEFGGLHFERLQPYPFAMVRC